MLYTCVYGKGSMGMVQWRERAESTQGKKCQWLERGWNSSENTRTPIQYFSDYVWPKNCIWYRIFASELNCFKHSSMQYRGTHGRWFPRQKMSVCQTSMVHSKVTMTLSRHAGWQEGLHGWCDTSCTSCSFSPQIWSQFVCLMYVIYWTGSVIKS